MSAFKDKKPTCEMIDPETDEVIIVNVADREQLLENGYEDAEFEDED